MSVLCAHAQEDDPWSFEISLGATLPFSFDDAYQTEGDYVRRFVPGVSGMLGFKTLWTKKTTFFLKTGLVGLRYETHDIPPTTLVNIGLEERYVSRHALVVPFAVGWQPELHLGEKSSMYLTTSLGVAASFLGHIRTEIIVPARPDLYDLVNQRGFHSPVIYPTVSAGVGYRYYYKTKRWIGMQLSFSKFLLIEPSLSFGSLTITYFIQ